jgi:hypothetical protein
VPHHIFEVEPEDVHGDEEVLRNILTRHEEGYSIPICQERPSEPN